VEKRNVLLESYLKHYHIRENIKRKKPLSFFEKERIRKKKRTGNPKKKRGESGEPGENEKTMVEYSRKTQD
jgi:hypothetical protein